MTFHQYMHEHTTLLFPRYHLIPLKDGIKLSIQGGRYYRSLPQEDLIDIRLYSHLEVTLYCEGKAVTIHRLLAQSEERTEWDRYYSGFSYELVPVALIEKLISSLTPLIEEQQRKAALRKDESIQVPTFSHSSNFPTSSQQPTDFTPQHDITTYAHDENRW